MKPAVLNILAFSIAFISVISCKKSNADTPAPAKSKTILLTQNTWKLQSVGMDADRNGVADAGGDLTASVPACQLDNSYTFKTDSTGVMNEGAATCNAGDPQTKPFTWGFKNGESILTGTFSITDGDAAIISMNDTLMVITYDDDFGTGTSYHLIAALKH
ncbi:MAG: hypothetical protein ABIQ88_04565 [Chitinophagaceae bacterium]